MRLGVLFSGGKDSTYAAFLAKSKKDELTCLISLWSENKDSFMFHTPAIKLTKKQARLMRLPLIVKKTKGEKEEELQDLKKAIQKAIKKYHIQGIVTGALQSVYQASRIQKICEELRIHCINPLWQKDQLELLNELIENEFEVVISGVAAYSLDKTWIGRKIDKDFVKEVSNLAEKYHINPAGEGGEFESLVLNCGLFKKRLNVKLNSVSGKDYSWRGEFI